MLPATCILLLSTLLAAQSFPKPLGRVSDFAGVIDPAIEAEIDHRLDLLEQQTSSEIAVATVESLAGMSVEEYANRLFKEWGVGQAKQDNGVLVLVAPKEREMRIEVGYGLEGVLPDGLSGQIVREQFTPRFRDGDYSGGIRDGVARVADIVQKHQVLTPEELAQFNQGAAADVPYWFVIPFFGLFVTIGFGMIGVGARTKAGFPLLFGTFFGGMPLAMSIALLGYGALVTEFPLALLATWVGYRLGGLTSLGHSFRKTATLTKSGWVMTDSSGWSSSDSSSSDSSSSSSDSDFGGGSSGGGGASGSW